MCKPGCDETGAWSPEALRSCAEALIDYIIDTAGDADCVSDGSAKLDHLNSLCGDFDSWRDLLDAVPVQPPPCEDTEALADQQSADAEERAGQDWERDRESESVSNE